MVLWNLKLKNVLCIKSNITIFANARNSMTTCISFNGIIVFSLGTIAHNLINFGLLWPVMSSLALLTVLKNKLLPYIFFSFAYHRKNSYNNVNGLKLNLVSTFVSFKGCLLSILLEKCEDTKRAIRIPISKKNRQHNGQKKKYKRANNDLQIIHINLNNKNPTKNRKGKQFLLH